MKCLHSVVAALAAGVALCATTVTQASAQASAHARRTASPDTVGVLIVAHGGATAWNSRVDSLAAAVRSGGAVAGPVAVAFLMGPAAPAHRFQDAVTALRRAGARRIVAVPLLVSSHSGHFEQLRYLARLTDSLDTEMHHHLHMSGIARAETTVPIVVTPALDDSPELATVVAERARALAPAPAGRGLLIFGHGPNTAEDYAAWMQHLRRVADSVRATTGFAYVTVELVRDDAPAHVRAEAVTRARELVTLQRAATGRDVVVVPLLISAGDLTRSRVPADLAGLGIAYAGDPLLPHPALVRWVERRVREAVTRAAADIRPR